jgi:hypothetical protein
MGLVLLLLPHLFPLPRQRVGRNAQEVRVKVRGGREGVGGFSGADRSHQQRARDPRGASDLPATPSRKRCQGHACRRVSQPNDPTWVRR